MGNRCSSPRLQVTASVPARAATVLNRFFQEDPAELTIAEYYEKHVVKHLRRWTPSQAEQQFEYELQNVFIRLEGEDDDIEVTSFDDACGDYLSMGLKKVTFALKLVTKEQPDAGEQEEESDDGWGDDLDEMDPLPRDDAEDDDANRRGTSSNRNSMNHSSASTGAMATPPSAPAGESKTKQSSIKKQKTMGAFFGSVLKIEYGRDSSGCKVLKSSKLVELQKNAEEKVYLPESIHCRFCNREFSHAPALVQHEKACEMKLFRVRGVPVAAATAPPISDEVRISHPDVARADSRDDEGALRRDACSAACA